MSDLFLPSPSNSQVWFFYNINHFHFSPDINQTFTREELEDQKIIHILFKMAPCLHFFSYFFFVVLIFVYLCTSVRKKKMETNSLYVYTWPIKQILILITLCDGHSCLLFFLASL